MRPREMAGRQDTGLREGEEPPKVGSGSMPESDEMYHFLAIRLLTLRRFDSLIRNVDANAAANNVSHYNQRI